MYQAFVRQHINVVYKWKERGNREKDSLLGERIIRRWGFWSKCSKKRQDGSGRIAGY